MIPGYGKSGSEIPLETQLLLLEIKEESVVEDDDSSAPATPTTFYVLFLPVLDGDFRTSLQGTPANELQFCAESGWYFIYNLKVFCTFNRVTIFIYLKIGHIRIPRSNHTVVAYRLTV